MGTMTPEQYARLDFAQDVCENAPFASTGGPDRRGSMTAPNYITHHEREAYLEAYHAAAHEHYGADWKMCSFGWVPTITIEPTPCTHVRNPDGACVRCGDE